MRDRSLLNSRFSYVNEISRFLKFMKILKFIIQATIFVVLCIVDCAQSIEIEIFTSVEDARRGQSPFSKRFGRSIDGFGRCTAIRRWILHAVVPFHESTSKRTVFQVTRIVFSSVTRRRKAARPLLIKRTTVPLGCSWIRDSFVPQKFTSVLNSGLFTKLALAFLTDLHPHKLPREGNGSSSRRSLQIASSSTNKLLNYFSFNGKRKGNVAERHREPNVC